MNNSWIEKVIFNFFTTNIDHFGERSAYHGFEGKNLIQNSPDGFQSDQLHGNILYTDEQGTIRRSNPIFIKLTPDNPITYSNFGSLAFANEINFYSKIVPIMETFDDSFSSLFPKFFHGEMMFNRKANKSAIIFEDVRTRDYKMTEKKSFLDFQHLALMMRKLGAFHAYSYKAKNTSPDLFHPMADIFQEINLFVNKEGGDFLRVSAQRGFELLRENVEYKQYVPKIEAMIENADDVFAQILTSGRDDPISVIIHGDYLRNNLMFRYRDNIPQDLIMIDMATCRYASPVIDLTIVLYLNADQATRNKYWDKLIDEYYTALQGTFPENKVPSKSEIMSNFVGTSFYAYLVASYFLPRLMEIDYKIPLPPDVDPDVARSYRERKFHEISMEMWYRLTKVIGGERSTQELYNVLLDMIDRGFICI
ncbi:uncharacterized protein LOC135848402 [Planococcus citri]|uniref:uncharacterized protein LOC135848402 n=1 Tax=Planococcus citri TaxID=170843 RepID=UPI0031F797AB